MPELDARIPCESETRNQIRALKQGQERYEEVLRRMLREYEGNQ